MVIWQLQQTYNIKRIHSMLCRGRRWEQSALLWSSHAQFLLMVSKQSEIRHKEQTSEVWIGDSTCPLCDREDESHEQLFSKCPPSQDIWSSLGRWINVQLPIEQGQIYHWVGFTNMQRSFQKCIPSCVSSCNLLHMACQKRENFQARPGQSQTIIRGIIQIPEWAHQTYSS